MDIHVYMCTGDPGGPHEKLLAVAASGRKNQVAEAGEGMEVGGEGDFFSSYLFMPFEFCTICIYYALKK